jgi:hypothetical protein
VRCPDSCHRFLSKKSITYLIETNSIPISRTVPAGLNGTIGPPKDTATLPQQGTEGKDNRLVVTVALPLLIQLIHSHGKTSGQQRRRAGRADRRIASGLVHGVLVLASPARTFRPSIDWTGHRSKCTFRDLRRLSLGVKHYSS